MLDNKLVQLENGRLLGTACCQTDNGSSRYDQASYTCVKYSHNSGRHFKSRFYTCIPAEQGARL